MQYKNWISLLKHYHYTIRPSQQGRFSLIHKMRQFTKIKPSKKKCCWVIMCLHSPVPPFYLFLMRIKNWLNNYLIFKKTFTSTVRSINFFLCQDNKMKVEFRTGVARYTCCGKHSILGGPLLAFLSNMLCIKTLLFLSW